MGSGFRNLGFLGLQGFGLRESGCEDLPYVGTVSGALCLSESLTVCLPASPSLHLVTLGICALARSAQHERTHACMGHCLGFWVLCQIRGATSYRSFRYISHHELG